MSSFTINSNVSNVAKLAKLKIQVLLWRCVCNIWNTRDCKTCPSNKHATRKASHEYCTPLSSVVLPSAGLTIHKGHKLTKWWGNVPNAEEFKYTPTNVALTHSTTEEAERISSWSTLWNFNVQKYMDLKQQGVQSVRITLFSHEKFPQCSFALQAMIIYISCHHHGQGVTVFRYWTTPLNYHCINSGTT